MSNLEKGYLDEIDFYIETLMNDEYASEKDKEKVSKLTKEDKKYIVDKMLDDNELNEELNSTINYWMFH
jgi:CBS domain containing-hemolysin-like protein